MSHRELEFAVFCIEGIAARLGVSGSAAYDALTKLSGLLYSYIVPNYEALHTQDREYILDDILGVMSRKGVTL